MCGSCGGRKVRAWGSKFALKIGYDSRQFANTATVTPSRLVGSRIIYRSFHDWTLLPDNPETHERRFVSPSGDTWLALYARPPTRDIEAHLEGVRNHEYERITYERRGRAWIVVSGYKAIGYFTEKLCWPAAVGLGITSHLNIRQSKSELLINSHKLRAAEIGLRSSKPRSRLIKNRRRALSNDCTGSTLR